MATLTTQSVERNPRSADWAATDAVEVLLVTRGLVELVDGFRFRDAGAPIPAPGTADAADEVRAHALDAVHAAATARILAGADSDPDELRAPDGSPEPDPAAMAAVDRAHEALAAARRVLRHLAQVGLGVAQHAYDDDDVELLERATVRVLSRDVFWTATEDAFPLRGTTGDEVSVELAGLIARMLCDAGVGEGFTLVGPVGPGIDVELAPDRSLRLRTTDPGGGVLAPLGWEVDATGTAIRAFAGPVTITQVTSLVLRTLRDGFGADLSRLALRWDDPGQSTLFSSRSDSEAS